MTDAITQQVIARQKARPDLLPVDPDCEALKYFSIERGVQGILRIDGSDSLIYLMNPDDGREPYLVIRNPHTAGMMTTKLHRKIEGEDDYGDLSG